MSVPRVASYRVQLRPEFGFEAARELVDYWARLGVSHLYASPYLQAGHGSSHGYDVVDHGRVNGELGGEAGRKALSEALRERGLAQILDVVPNHMAIRGGHNAWWWDVLENGPSSRYSSYFDVEWQAATQDHVLLPVLGDQYGVELEAGHLQLAREGPSFLILYHEHRNPVAPRSLGPIFKEAAELTHSDDLAFLADAFHELPLANAPDRRSRERRHRDKQVLERSLTRLLEERADLASAIDQVIAQINADPDRLHDVLEHQNYRLAYWRFGNHELDYRRFFDIDSLVGLRVEDEEVFNATHELPLRWLAEGALEGLRIDHVDGLYDPAGYLQRLRDLAPNAWLLVEKILEGDERLPDFPVEGTTGYEFLNHVQRLFVAPEGQATLDELHQRLNPKSDDALQLARKCKRLVLEEALASDLNRLLERLVQICQQHRRYRDFSRVELRRALREVCVAFPVYRSYLAPQDQRASQRDRDVIERACREARDENPALDPRLFEFLEQLLLLAWPGAAEREFVLRWQQFSGPAMAKGLEDTAFYRHARLVALNEVGGDPGHFFETVDEYHAFMRERQARQPWALNATSTHDTKRSEDARARLWVLSEIPERWAEAVERWRARLEPARRANAATGLEQVPESGTEYFLLQNLVSVWPLDKQRMLEFTQKALREAKLHSSWQRPDEAYEHAVSEYLEKLYQDRELTQDIDTFVASLCDAGYANSLGQVVLKLLSPGVPDIYQGSELWDFSLVDPDNRRPVDYGRRRQLLAELERLSPEELWARRAEGAVKLHFLQRGLELRRRRGQVFSAASSYEPMSAFGPRQQRIVAFSRADSVIAVVARWFAKFGDDFSNTELRLPVGEWRNVLAPGRRFSGTVPIADLLAPFPAAVLELTGKGHVS